LNTSTDRIERRILLKVPRSRVWRALSDAEEFGNWFGVNFKGETFVAGAPARGHITHPGYEHLQMEVTIERVVPERLLSWRWNPASTRFRRRGARRCSGSTHPDGINK
jgi:uncharacterized protein YndB with AHSA1/START domain